MPLHYRSWLQTPSLYYATPAILRLVECAGGYLNAPLAHNLINSVDHCPPVDPSSTPVAITLLRN